MISQTSSGKGLQSCNRFFYVLIHSAPETVNRIYGGDSLDERQYGRC